MTKCVRKRNCDPNLIIKLLHININYNYFEFASLIYQQIKGTAMGAAFSPTIANIFLSVTIQKFLQTQEKKPTLLKRYIDDIIVIWPHPEEDIKKFLSDLNDFYQSLRYTWTISDTSVDYLDVTIFKGFSFQMTNLMDTKTFQKPKNLYQYLHYNSYHPRAVFKGLIKGECIRYIRTNSSPENYRVCTELFKRRLLRRQYPVKFVEKAIQSIKYSQRQNYLKTPPPTVQLARKLIFKCLPLPQFTNLKAIILQQYHKIQRLAPRPRFITLKSHTLGRELIRSRAHPTDEQFVDIVLIINGETNTIHKTAGKMPQLLESSPITKTCNHPRCVTCTHLNCNNHFRSTATGKIFPIRHSFTCTSSNIIYLITCTKCKKQYVGYTTTQLNQRISRHRSNIVNHCSIYICVHFNFSDHNLKNLSVQIIDTAPNIEQLKQLEIF